MKKIFLCFLAFALSISCATNDNEGNSQLKELSGKIVQFKSGKELHDTQVQETGKVFGASAGFAFVIFRKSTNCLSGWGICKLAAFWINIYNSGRFDNEPNYGDIVPKGDGTFYGHIELSSAVPAGYGTDFYIDQDLDVGTAYRIKSGIYKIDPTMGAYGGYKLNVVKL